VTLAGTGLAGAASSGSPQPPGPHTHAPRAVTAATLCDQLWAVVNSDGSLARAGCPNTSSKSLSTGTYQVNFPHVITNCAFVATVGLSGFSGTSAPGMVTVVGRAGTNNALFIQTSDKTGTLASLGFHVSVQCPPAKRFGKVNIAAGNTTRTVSVPGGISSASVGLATVQSNAAVWVKTVVTSTSAGTITIRLNKAPSGAVTVGWSVVDN